MPHDCNNEIKGWMLDLFVSTNGIGFESWLSSYLFSLLFHVSLKAHKVTRMISLSILDIHIWCSRKCSKKISQIFYCKWKEGFIPLSPQNPSIAVTLTDFSADRLNEKRQNPSSTKLNERIRMNTLLKEFYPILPNVSLVQLRKRTCTSASIVLHLWQSRN